MIFEPKGVLPAMVTPLTPDYEVNEAATRKLVDFLIGGGVHGLFVVGTSGEFYGLSADEKRKVIEICMDQAAGRVPIYAATNGMTTRETIQLTKMAAACKVDAVSILTPMLISPSQEELFEHYKAVAEAVSVPILLYNNLPKTQVTLTPKTVRRLAELENIVGVKDSSGDFSLTAEYIRNTRDLDFHVLAGRDTLIHACLCYGGQGAIAACANIAPRLLADIYDKYVAGDIAGSLEAQYRIAPIRMAFGLGSFPTVLKESLELMGIAAGPSYGPIGKMSAEEKVQLRQVLTTAGVLS